MDNLSKDIEDDHRRKLFADIVDFIRNPPPSQPDILNGSMTNPLGMMRWDGSLDSRPAAVLAAAYFACEEDEMSRVRDLAIRMIGVAGQDDQYVAQALQVIKADLNDIAPLLAQAGWAMGSIAAIAWARSSTMAPSWVIC